MVKQLKQIFKEIMKERLSEQDKRKLIASVKEKVAKADKAERETRERRKMKKVKVKGKKGKITTKDISMGEYRRMMVARVFKSKSEKKGIAKRAKAVKGIMTSMGVIQGPQTRSGAGRPTGTFKYGMPIHVYKKMMRDKKTLYQRYQQEQAMKLSSRGFTPEQLQQLQQQQAIREMQQPQYEEEVNEEQETQQMPQEYQEIQQIPTQMPQFQQKQGYGRIIPRSQQIRPGRSIADDELDFRQWSAETTISPRTQRVLDTIRRIQNKGKTDNIEQQRVLRERRMVSGLTNMFHANRNKIDVNMDFTKVDMNENILGAPNMFKKDLNTKSILKSYRPNILQTKEVGNSLFF